MGPFLKYFGSKFRAARLYPEPRHDLIIEPFAGSAGYALRYYDRDVLLIDKNPKVSGVWDYLIHADPEQILALPDIGPEGIDAHPDLSDAERWLIGWWLNTAVTAPRKTPIKWALWGPKIRHRLASQVPLIRHWRIVCGDYADAPDVTATWFIDPPYWGPVGRHYPTRLEPGDYGPLADWCRARSGQVFVCENEGAQWLPFVPLARIPACNRQRRKRESFEAIYTNTLESPAQSESQLSREYTLPLN